MSGKPSRRRTAVLSDDSQRIDGGDALSMNVAAGSAVAEAVRTTLGPRGMDKMLVSGSGDVVVTNDGATVVAEMDIDHPVAEMVADLTETQDAAVGDGTTTAVVLAGALLDEAGDLLDRGIHPSTVVTGYRRAADAVGPRLDDISVAVSSEDTALLEGVARTAMTGKRAESGLEELAPLVVEAVRHTVVDGEPDADSIKVHPFRGAPVGDSRLVEGMMVDREPDNPNMPTELDEAEILLLEGELGVSEAAAGGEVTVANRAQLDAFVEREREELAALARGIVDADVDVVFSTGTIDDDVQAQLARAGVLSAENLRDPDVEKLERTTGASLVSNLSTLSADDLGYAGEIRQELVRAKYGPKTAAPEKSLVVSGVADPRAVALVVRGGTEHAVDEVERAVEDALAVVAAAIADGVVLPGGGAPETHLALALRDAADGVDGREQLAVEAVADALEAVPRTLAENGGADPIDALVDLRSRHRRGETAAGVDADGAVADMNDAGVVEPRRVKTEALTAGIEAITAILRIDDVVAAGDLATGDDEAETDGRGGVNPY